MDLENSIKSKAKQLGFEIAGITAAAALDNSIKAGFEDWLNRGCAGEMEYLHNNLDKRFNPSLLLENAKSVICLGYPYKLNRLHDSSDNSNKGRIADYSLYPDYHSHLKSKLFELAEFIDENIDEDFKIKACVDSVPIAERSFAKQAGLGFITQNSMLTNPEIGSEFFLALLITTIELKPDKPIEAETICKDCNKCVLSCPTGAITAEGLNASKCINYLTIEHKSEIPQELASKIGNNLYGCDVCVNICPYNQDKTPASKEGFKPNHELEYIDLDEIESWTNSDFKEMFNSSPIERIGLDRMKRNARIVKQNQNS